MPTARHTLLKWLSAAVWYIGAVMLLWKGSERLLGAAAELGSLRWSVTVGVVSMGLGILQGRTVFRAACVRNLRRIRALESPRPWQFFRPGFFLALAAMIGGAGVLSAVADQGPAAALVVAGVDWLVGFSLAVSSFTFWGWERNQSSESRGQSSGNRGQGPETRAQRPEPGVQKPGSGIQGTADG